MNSNTNRNSIHQYEGINITSKLSILELLIPNLFPHFDLEETCHSLEVQEDYNTQLSFSEANNSLPIYDDYEDDLEHPYFRIQSLPIFSCQEFVLDHEKSMERVANLGHKGYHNTRPLWGKYEDEKENGYHSKIESLSKKFVADVHVQNLTQSCQDKDNSTSPFKLAEAHSDDICFEAEREEMLHRQLTQYDNQEVYCHIFVYHSTRIWD